MFVIDLILFVEDKCLYNVLQPKVFLNTAIESVLNQSKPADEILIIDDCSNDGSQNLIDSFYQRYPDLIKPIYNETNLGVTKTRNKAISLLRGDLVSSLDGDDYWEKDKLKYEYETLLDQNLDYVFSNFYFFNNIEKSAEIWLDEEIDKDVNIYKRVLLRKFPRSLFRSELVKVDLLKNVGAYDESLNLYEDYEMRIRLTKSAKGSMIFKPLHYYRIHEDGLSKTMSYNHVQAFYYIYGKHKTGLDHTLRSEFNQMMQHRIKVHLLKMAGKNESFVLKAWFKLFRMSYLKAVLIFPKVLFLSVLKR